MGKKIKDFGFVPDQQETVGTHDDLGFVPDEPATEPVKKKEDTAAVTGSSGPTSLPTSTDSSAPGEQQSKPSGEATDLKEQAIQENGGRVMDNIFTGLYDLGRKAISTIKDEMVGAYHTEKAIQKKTDLIDELIRTNPTQYAVANEYASPETRRKYAEKQALKEFGADLPKKIKEYAGTSIAAKQADLLEAAKQKEEGAKFTEGIPRTWEEATSTGKIPSYIGAAMGNGLAQIPASLATLGASSYFMEKTGAYDEAVSAIAKESGLTPEQVVEQGKDQPAKEIAHVVGLVNGGIDLASSAFTVAKGIGAGVKQIIKKKASEEILKALPESLLKKGIKAAAVPLTEYATEFAQGTNSQIGALVASGKDIKDIDWEKDIDWNKSREEGLQGLFGSIGVAGTARVISPAQTAAAEQVNVKDSGDLAAAAQAADKIQEAVNKTEDGEITKQTGELSPVMGTNDVQAVQKVDEGTIPSTIPGTDQSAGLDESTITGATQAIDQGSTITQPTEEVTNDRENQQRIPSEIGGRQEPVQAGAIGGTGQEAPGTGRVLQSTPEEKITTHEQIAKEYHDEVRNPSVSAEERTIADEIGKVSGKSVERFGDKNAMTGSIGKSYISKDGDSIDQVAQRASYALNPNGDGTEISPDQVWEFMKKYPQGAGTIYQQAGNPKLRELGDRYKAITGKSINRKIAKDISDSVVGKVGNTTANTEVSRFYDRKGGLDHAKLLTQLEKDPKGFQEKFGLSDQEFNNLQQELHERQSEKVRAGSGRPDQRGTGETRTPAVQGGSLSREFGDTSKDPAQHAAEIKGKPLSHAAGLNMGKGISAGTYVSTEEKNRYGEAEKATTTIQAPFVFKDESQIIPFRNQILNENFDKFDPEDFDGDHDPFADHTIDQLSFKGIDKLADLVRTKLQGEGYDSIYLPESATQEGELIVFDPKNVQIGEQQAAPPIEPPPSEPPVPPTQGAPPAEGKGAEKYAILDRILKSDVSPEVKRGIKERGETYIPKGLDITYAEAEGLIELYGEEKAEAIVRDLTNGFTPDTRVALTAKLYQSYVDKGMNEEAVDIAMWQADQSVQAGRAGNAAKIWKMITQSGEDNIVLAIEKEQNKQVESVVEPVRQELAQTRTQIDAEIQRIIEEKVQEGVKERLGRAKLITKEKKKEISDFFDSLKGELPKGMMLSSPAPLIVKAYNAAIEVAKQAVLTGASVANAVQAGINYFRGEVGDKFDEKVFREHITPQLEKLVPVDAAKVDQDKITAPKLTGRKKKEFIDEVLKAYNDGKLTDKKFDELYAKKLGVKELSTEDRNKIRELAKTISQAEQFETELNKSFTRENIEKHKGYVAAARKANQQLQEFSTAPNNIWDTFISIMQGNLLSSMSLVSNVFYNLAFQPLRFSSTGIGGMLDYSISRLAKAANIWKGLQDRTIDLMAAQKGYFKGGWAGTIEGIQQLWTGTQADERNLREIQSGFNPGRAWERLSNKDATTAQKANDYVEGTIGWEAEVMFRLLNAGDKPWKRAAEMARAYELGSLKGLKGVDLQKFLLLPDEASKEDIQKAGQQATFQQSDAAGKKLQSSVTNALNMIAKIPIIGGPAKVILKSQIPYIKTPWNLIAETMTYAAPPITAAVGIHQIATGNKRQGSILVGKAVVGAMIQAAAYQLFMNGLLTGDDDKEKKKRDFQQEGTPPANSINISGLNRMLSGGDPAAQDKDVWVSYQKMGTAGVLLDNYANTYKNRIAETGTAQAGTDTYFADMLTSGPKVASSTLDQTFLQGTSTFLEAIRGGSERAQETWLIKTSEAVAAIAYPNTISTLSKASDEFNRDTEDKTFVGRLANTYKTKVFAGSTLPPKVTIWGDRVTGNPEGRSKYAYYLFDPSKFKAIDTDNFRYQLYQAYKTDYDGDWLPSMPQRQIKHGGVEKKLTPMEYELFSTIVGQQRADLVSGYINSAKWSTDSPDDRKADLKYLYGLGLDYGKRQFLMDTGANVKADFSKPIAIKILEHNLSRYRQKIR